MFLNEGLWKILYRVRLINLYNLMKNLMLFVVIGSFLATGCKKYSDGGLVSKADKRLSANSWKLQKYLRNGNDETSQLLISNFTETFAMTRVLEREVDYSVNTRCPS